MGSWKVLEFILGKTVGTAASDILHQSGAWQSIMMGLDRVEAGDEMLGVLMYLHFRGSLIITLNRT